MEALQTHPGSTSAAPADMRVAAGEYLSFRLGSEEYGIEILKVQEIRSYEAPTRLANAPAMVAGVINLRGVIVPLIDLRMKLGCERAEIDASTVVIVLNVHGHVLGAIVDGVNDVTALSAEQIRPAPQLDTSNLDASFITGIASLPGRMVVLLDIEVLLSGADLGVVRSVH